MDPIIIGAILFAAAATPDATAVVGGIGGLIQPYIQEILVRNKLAGRGAAALTFGVSLVVALVATYFTGGFAGTQLPAFTPADPSPLLAYIWPKWVTVYALSQ